MCCGHHKPLKTMADEIIENPDSSNGENENLDSLNEETGEEEILDDPVVLKEKVNDLSGKNKQLFERAKKAEGFEKNAEGKWMKIQKPEAKPEAELKPQSNEPDYAKIAFLEQRGLTHPDDQKLVQDEAARLKLPLTDILNMGHIKSQLETIKDQREAMAGMPKGRGKAGGGATQQDVDYWIDQKNPDGTFKTPDDPALAEKVIEARINKEKQGNKFSDELFTG